MSSSSDSPHPPDSNRNAEEDHHLADLMRFSITMDDDLVTLIDIAAREQGINRPEYIRCACTEAVASKDHQESTTDAAGEVQRLRALIEVKDQQIEQLLIDVQQWRGQAAALTAKIPALPAPRRGIMQGLKELIYGTG